MILINVNQSVSYYAATPGGSVIRANVLVFRSRKSPIISQETASKRRARVRGRAVVQAISQKLAEEVNRLVEQSERSRSDWVAGIRTTSRGKAQVKRRLSRRSSR